MLSGLAISPHVWIFTRDFLWKLCQIKPLIYLWNTKCHPFNPGDKEIISVLSYCIREIQWCYTKMSRVFTNVDPCSVWTPSKKTFPTFHHHSSVAGGTSDCKFLQGQCKPRTFRLEGANCRFIQTFSASTSRFGCTSTKRKITVYTLGFSF